MIHGCNVCTGAVDEQLAMHLQLLHKAAFAASRKVVRLHSPSQCSCPHIRIFTCMPMCVMQDISDAEVELQEQASVFRSKLLAQVAEIERQRQVSTLVIPHHTHTHTHTHITPYPTRTRPLHITPHTKTPQYTPHHHPKPQHAAQMERERRQLANAVKRQEAERQRRLKEDAQALARKNQEINQRLEEAKRMQELADQERAAAKARLQQQMVRMGRVGVVGVCACMSHDNYV